MGNNTGKYVADVFDIDKVIEEHGKKIMLIAGVGAGKSSWVKDVLTKKGNVLFVTSRRAKVDEDIGNSVFSTFVKEPENEKYSLITNAKLARILQNAHLDSSMTVDEFLDYYDYIVVDEVHSIATDSSFDLFTFIEYAAETDHTVIVMTGTPEPVELYFKRKEWYIVDYRETCNYVRPAKIQGIYQHTRFHVIKEALENGEKVIYFVNNTNTIKDIIKLLEKYDIGDLGKIAVITADDKWKQTLKIIKKDVCKFEETLSTYTYECIVKKQMLPEECDILIATSRLKEGIDIKNDNICMLCDNHILSNLIQFFGRIRLGGGKVYIIKDASQHSIKTNELLFDYAQKKEVVAANQYIQENLQDDKTDLGNIFDHIKYLERNPYIRYNWIKGYYELFFIKYLEEKRLEQIKDCCWEKIAEYCEKYEIDFSYMSPAKMKEIYRIGLDNSVNRGIKYDTKNSQDLLRHILCQV